MLFQTPLQGVGTSTHYAVAADGQRFLLFRAADTGPAAVNRLELVQNWFEEIERLVPVE